MPPMIAEPRSRRPRPTQNSAAPPPKLADEGLRLAKCVASIMSCSRREAEQYIEGGWVTVDGKLVEESQFRVTQQRVEIDKDASLMESGDVTLLLNKPPGVASDQDDDDDDDDDDLETRAQGRERHQRHQRDDSRGTARGAARNPAPIKSAMQLLNAASHFNGDPADQRVLKRHFSKLTAGLALETGASGLVIFTQDWRVARKLDEDAHVMEQELMVEVRGPVAPEILKRLNHGLIDNGQPLPPVKVSASSSSDTATTLRIALKGSHPGLIAYLCERVGLEIVSMKRIRVGRVSMTQLPVGQWRYLGAHERF